MKNLSNATRLTTTCLSLLSLPLMAGKNSVVEFDPKEAKSLAWRVVDDGVMGGLSQGNLKVSEEGILTFSGDLSLENNGGFSSLRTGNLKLDLSAAEGLIARVKGDGRTYQIRLGTDARFRGMEVSFMAEIATKKDQWTEVKIPFESFTGSFRGMKLKDEVLDPAKIRRIGLLLGDKKSGPFKTQVDWIRTYGSDSSNLLSMAQSDGRFGTLAKALTEAQLVDVLKGGESYTVFAPTDKAFAALPEGTLESLLKPENREQLQALLKFHVVPGSVTLANALDASKATTVLGEPVKIAFSEGRVRVGEAAILDADLTCSNGVIHVIDTVLLPPKPANDLASVAKQAGSFGTLLAAVEAAGLSSALSGEGPLTVFAPTDKAFEALPDGTVESLLKPENRQKLAEILALHVISGKVSAGDALNTKQAKSLGGEALTFGIKDGQLKVNCATILKTDISADNGVIHVIDSVILPTTEGECNQAPKAVSDKSPVELIETALEKGVPIFNQGDHDKCAQIYRDCLVALANDQRVEDKLGAAMRGLVERSSKIKSGTQRAWVLRSGLDHVYSALAKS